MLLRKRSNVSDGRRRERRRALERACWRSMCEIIFQKKKKNNGSLEELHLNSWCEAQ